MGQALGPCIAAPLSETFGRKGVFLITGTMGLLFTLGSGLSQNYGSLCVLRFFAGLLSSPSLSVGGGIIVDILEPVHRSAATGLWVGAALCGTSLGPMTAGFAVQKKGWRWTQWIFIFVTLTGWIPSLFTSESYKKILLQRRAKKRGQDLPDNMAASAMAKTKFFLTITLFRPIAMLIKEPIVAYFTLYLSVVFAVLFSFFDAFPIVFSGVYGFNLGEAGISFLGLFTGVVIGIAIHMLIDRLTYKKMILAQKARGEIAPIPPEERLYPAMIGAPLISISMFWFAWSSKASTHWISSEIATVFFGIGIMGLSAPCMQYRKSSLVAAH